MLVPGVYCAQHNASSNGTLVDFLTKVAGPQLLALLGTAGAGGAGAGALLGSLGPLAAVRVQCVDAPGSFSASSADIDKKLYCGYYQAKCNGVVETNQYTTAFDFSSATSSSMTIAIYYNDSLSISSGGRGGGGGGAAPPVRYTRMAGLVNMAVNSWVEKFLGRWAAGAAGPGLPPACCCCCTWDWPGTA